MSAGPTGRARSRLLQPVILVVCSVAIGAVALLPASASPASGPKNSPAVVAGDDQQTAFLSGDSKTNCVFPDSNLTDLAMLESLVGTTYDCVLLYNDDKPDWQSWTNVWWTSPPSPDSDWLGWLTGAPGRRLIISQPMVPDDAPSDWAELGAEGDYDTYATQLAENLVNEGMGNSVIRLGWEANNPSNSENALPPDSSDYSDWATYWDNIVTAMRAVPGADFQFDWTVNQYYEPVPLQEWYPGNDFVDIIGIDAYDSGIYQSGLTPEQRWQDLYNQPDGLGAVAAFAADNGKPLSIPEWGLATTAVGGAGDDPTFVQGLGSFIASNDVEYNSYFYSYSPSGDSLVYLPNAPQSLAAYQEYFPGISLGSTSTSTSAPSTSTPSSPSTTVASATTTISVASTSTSPTGPAQIPTTSHTTTSSTFLTTTSTISPTSTSASPPPTSLAPIGAGGSSPTPIPEPAVSATAPSGGGPTPGGSTPVPSSGAVPSGSHSGGGGNGGAKGGGRGKPLKSKPGPAGKGNGHGKGSVPVSRTKKSPAPNHSNKSTHTATSAASARSPRSAKQKMGKGARHHRNRGCVRAGSPAKREDKQLHCDSTREASRSKGR